MRDDLKAHHVAVTDPFVNPALESDLEGQEERSWRRPFAYRDGRLASGGLVKQ
jgi:hypothetical protein